MKIWPSRGGPEAAGRIGNERQPVRVRAAEGRAMESVCRINCSERGRMASDVRLALTHIPEIRIERVESLRRLLAEGKFCVEGEVVAERLLTGVM